MYKNFDDILKLNGGSFIEALLNFEQNRFDQEFLKGSVYEQINAEFGIFPAQKIYPMYFSGDVLQPQDKFIFIGMNPGYSEEYNKKEQEYAEKIGFLNYCRTIFQYFSKQHNGLIPYYSNIGGFLKRLYGIEKIDWSWYQSNFINLEMIPYHSANTSGLRINKPIEFRKIYFEILLKFLKHLNPKKPIFILGFPTFEKYLNQPYFKNIIFFKKYSNFWVGKIENKYDFIGLPFLTRVKGGKDALVNGVKKIKFLNL